MEEASTVIGVTNTVLRHAFMFFEDCNLCASFL
jgi:hypothetical protein